MSPHLGGIWRRNEESVFKSLLWNDLWLDVGRGEAAHAGEISLEIETRHLV